MKNALLFCLGALVFFASAFAADTESERMLALAKVWATVEFFHPYLGYQNIAWDAAVIRAAPAIRAARTKHELGGALAQLLGTLGDPVTRVVQPPQTTDYLAMTTQGRVDARLEDGVLILTVVDYPRAADLDKHLDELAHARAVVFDLREYRNLRFSPSLLDGSRMSHMLSTTPLLGPGYRRRTTILTGGYPVNSLTVEGGATIPPDPQARNIPAVFVLGSETVPPSFALAMHAAGRGFIVCEGVCREDPMVDVQRFIFAGDADVQIRLAELLYPDGSAGFQPDSVVSSGGVEKAVDIVRQSAPKHSSRPIVTAIGPDRLPWLDERHDPESGTETRYPDAGHRLIAVFRVWSVFQLLDAYRSRSREEWDRILQQFVPRVESAGNPAEYHVAIAEMIAQAHDAHAFTLSPVLEELGYTRGSTFPGYTRGPALPVAIRLIEDRLVVTRLLRPDTGLEAGDIILEIDGEDAIAKFRRGLAAFPGPAPHSGAIQYLIHGPLVNGPDNSTVKVLAQGGDGRRKQVTLVRSRPNSPYRPARDGDLLRILPGNIGYADLDRLPAARVDEMFEKLKDTRAIIFDLRTSLSPFTAWPIAARLTDEPLKRAWRTYWPSGISPDALTGSSTVFWDRVGREAGIRPLIKSEKSHYGGQTVALIDERAASSPEMSAMLLKSANGTVLIGGKTRGANGSQAKFWLPGGIEGRYSQTIIQWPDGRDVQGKGLAPDIEVAPTIEGVRAGRDEVLEKALRYLGISQPVHGVGEAK